MRRSFALVAVMLLVGCGTSQTPSASPSTSSSAPTTASATPSESVPSETAEPDATMAAAANELQLTEVKVQTTEGYTYSFDHGTLLDYVLDPTNDKPGQTSLVFGGSLWSANITNTTKGGRALPFTGNPFEVLLYFDASSPACQTLMDPGTDSFRFKSKDGGCVVSLDDGIGSTARGGGTLESGTIASGDIVSFTPDDLTGSANPNLGWMQWRAINEEAAIQILPKFNQPAAAFLRISEAAKVSVAGCAPQGTDLPYLIVNLKGIPCGDLSLTGHDYMAATDYEMVARAADSL